MEDIYELIEKKIVEAGYKGEASGYDIYNEISDEIEDKENGTYIFMSKKTDNIYFEYKVDVLDEEFNLSYIDIHDDEKIYHIDFDN